MKAFSCAAVLLTLSACSMGGNTAPSAGAAQPSQEDRSQVERIVHAFEEAWNRHDMVAFASLFHEDAEWVHWRGGLWSGRAAIYEGHRAIHETFYSTSHATVRAIEGLTFLAPNVAYLRVRSDMTGDQRAPGQTFRYRRMMLLTKRDGQWLIARGHNTRIHNDLQ